MARKSRKNLDIAVTTKPSDRLYKAGVYARISVEDSKNHSSIETQLFITENFIKKNFDIEYVKKYVDSGYSAFDKVRPAFDEMMNDVKTGVINCIIVKDLSRFGRNYIETAQLLESVLPYLGVRFIAIQEDFDSDKQSFRDSLALPLKSIINYAYSSDISKKVKSSLKNKIENGTYISPNVPFGYIKKQIKDESIYEINIAQAETVKIIFDLALSGVSIYQITKKLNNDDINNRIWYNKFVGSILRNDFYIGTYTAGKTDSSFLTKIVKKQPQNQWTIIKHHHPAIIDEATFARVQNLLEKDKSNNITIQNCTVEEDMFKDKLFCGDCGKKLRRTKRKMSNDDGIYYYFCSTYAETSGSRCSRKSIREDRLKAEILRQIEIEVEKARRYKEKQLIYESTIAHKLWFADRKRKLEILRNELSIFKDVEAKQGFYDALDQSAGYSRSDFRNVMLYWKSQADVIQVEISKVEAELEKYANEHSSDCAWVKMMLAYENMKIISEYMADDIIVAVQMYESELIVKFPFEHK